MVGKSSMKIKHIFPIFFSIAFALNRYHFACYKGNNSSKKNIKKHTIFGIISGTCKWCIGYHIKLCSGMADIFKFWQALKHIYCTASYFLRWLYYLHFPFGAYSILKLCPTTIALTECWSQTLYVSIQEKIIPYLALIAHITAEEVS